MRPRHNQNRQPQRHTQGHTFDQYDEPFVDEARRSSQYNQSDFDRPLRDHRYRQSHREASRQQHFNNSQRNFGHEVYDDRWPNDPGYFERYSGRAGPQYNGPGDHSRYYRRGDQTIRDRDDNWHVSYGYGGFGTHNNFQSRAPKGYTRSDERIKDDVCDRLMYSNVDASDVTIDVKNGCVMLDGTVPDRAMRYELEDIAASCMGVQDIENKVKVSRNERSAGNQNRTQSTAGSGGASEVKE